MSSPQKLFFIINPFSGGGKGKGVLALLPTIFKEGAYEWTHRFTEKKGHATELAREAVAGGYDIVVAAGGDGTVNEVAAGLIHSEAILGIVPTGSGNGLAMHLGLGREPGQALELIRQQHVITIDTCRLNEMPFVNLAGVGFDGFGGV